MLYGNQYKVRENNNGLKKMHNCIKKARNTKTIIIKSTKTLSDQVIHVHHIHNVNTASITSVNINKHFFFFYETYSVYTSNGEFLSILFVAELTEF